MRLSDNPTERTTAATDLLLSATAAAAALYLLLQAPAPSFRIVLWSGAFGLIALSAAAGAAFHGLVLTPGPRNALWQGVGICLGLAISLFLAAVLFDTAGTQTAGRALPVLIAAGLLIYAVSRMLPGLFIVFILYQGAALLAAMAAYGRLASDGALPGAGWVAAGLAVSLLAAAMQPLKGLRFTLGWEFDRNGLFHMVQAAGIVLLCVGVSRT